eukprot:4015638-Prymnesium_polylepis.1
MMRGHGPVRQALRQLLEGRFLMPRCCSTTARPGSSRPYEKARAAAARSAARAAHCEAALFAASF